MTKIWIVDAFANKPYTGNPAAVMIVDEFPEDAQKIAAEMNLSETAFVKKLGDNHFHIRWLTPAVEVKLCGHATLAASHILFEQNLVQSDEIILDSLSGPLSVKREKDGYTLDFPLQRTTNLLPTSPFQEALKIDVLEAVQAYDDVIILVKCEKELREMSPDITKLKAIDCRGIIVTAASQDYDFISRFFAPRVGVDEDPVTGSAHCKLGDYWSKRLGKTEFRAFQASNRGGEIDIRIENDRVFLHGHAITILEGDLLR